MGYLDANNQHGKPHMIVEGMEIPFLFYGRKVNQSVRKPTAEELVALPEVEMLVPMPHNLSGEACLQPQRGNVNKSRSKNSYERMEK